jgi:hypothetical protein
MSLQVDDFLSELEDYLKSHVDTQEYVIDMGEWVNASPQVAAGGWIGIYNQDISYEPRTLGRGSGAWGGELHIAVIVQYADYKSGRECTLELQRRVNKVMAAFMNAPFMTTFVDAVRGCDVSYSFIEDESETVYFQNAVLDFMLAFNTTMR